MTDAERENPPGEGGVVHLGLYGTGYTVCRIYIPDLPVVDRYWMPPRDIGAAPGPATCPYCLGGKPAPICSTDPRALRMWTIYERPRDYPESYVAREWMGVAGRTGAAKTCLTAPTLDAIRDALDAHLRAIGRGGLAMLVRMPRHFEDDPRIVETWL